MRLWNSLNSLSPASHDEVLYFIEHHRLMGKGIGFIDAHLLASVVLAADTALWTLDKRLAHLASGLALNWS